MIRLLNLLSHFVVSYWPGGLLALKGVHSLALVMKGKRNLPKAIFSFSALCQHLFFWMPFCLPKVDLCVDTESERLEF